VTYEWTQLIAKRSGEHGYVKYQIHFTDRLTSR
jgi:hypothetical protein